MLKITERESMEKFNIWMESKFVPIAAKIGSEKHLIAIRDAFIAMMPITMAGAIAVLLNVLVRDIPSTEWVNQPGIPAAFSWLISINGNVWWGTNAMFALVLVFALGYNLSKAYDVNPLSGGLVAFASYITTVPAATAALGGWGYVAWSYTNGTAIFTAMFVGFVSTLIFAKLMKSGFTIKLPDTVPPAVGKAFTAIIPGTISIFTFGVLTYLLTTYAKSDLYTIISTYVQQPFMGLSQGLPAVIIMTFFVQLFWFFGLHGSNILGPALDGIYGPALTMNTAAFQLKEKLPFLWTRGSFDAYAWMGGAGCTLALVIAILWLSKREEQRVVAKLSLPMGVFNINEPVMFGIPVVLSPIYFIPFIVIAPLLVTIAYLVTAVGLVPPVALAVPWIVPPVLYAFLATGGSLAAALLALFNLALATLIWAFFVKLANKV
jgi:PTS system cellobiose-specific IIC component